MRILLALMVGCGVHAACATEFPWDLRGMLRVEGEPLVNVADPATGQGMWIMTGQEFQGWKFEGLDAREARARFSHAGETVEVDLIATLVREGTEAEPMTYTLPPLRMLNAPEAGALGLGLRLLLSDAPDAAWMDLARRENLTIQRGPIGENGLLSYAYAVNEPGNVPEVRPVPVPEDGSRPSISLTDEHVWILVHARPKGPNDYSIELGKFPRSRPSTHQMPPIPTLREGEDPADHMRRIQEALENWQERQMDGAGGAPPQ